ncbi:hypothetical protein [uncultured Corynebacterium sp.]|uniref:hypothetical protein n=1 Tax=uncultured Corynebacterium sp. TaxID=159447 RepID=UPI00259ADAA6|nr:hypothetical protein [uncultured Corynebacterium sp.]
MLDEPTNGLDPSGIGEVRDLLTERADRGTTVMISSHILDEVQKVATCYGVINEGKLLFQGSAAELFARSIPDLLIQTDAPAPIRLAGLGMTGFQVSSPGSSANKPPSTVWSVIPTPSRRSSWI